MIRLQILREDTLILSTVCAQCPEGPAGCCVAPPEYDWSDVGRVVRRGGLDWILAQIAAKRLTPVSRGLAVKRVRKREDPLLPRESKCVFHGKEGCTIPHERRSATCNYFVCEHVFRDGGSGTPAARQAHAVLKDAYERWDGILAERVASTWPEGAPWDAAFVAWLGEQSARLAEAYPGGLAAVDQAAAASGAPGGAPRIAFGSDPVVGDDPAHVQDDAQASGSPQG